MTLGLSRPEADAFAPGGEAAEEALARVTHLGIAAHADDLEIMAYHGIHRSHADDEAHFGGIVCTDGSGAPRAGAFASVGNEEMRELRREEQREAARRGEYAVVVQLDHPSVSLKRGVAPEVRGDLATLIERAGPQVVYTHNPMDAHATHLGVCAATIDAIRSLPAAARPASVLGCEGWRSLDWLDDADRTRLELGDDPAGWQHLIRAFASQVEGGRPYDQGALARAASNAVFDESHETTEERRLWLAVDLTPLTRDDGASLEEFVKGCLARFERNLLGALAEVRGSR